MPILYVLSGSDIGKTYELDHGATLGRALECEATLRGTSISRKHARLERDGETWTLIDMGSRNGLHLNGVRVDQIRMEEGGTFHIGDLELRFREEAQGVQLVREQQAPEPVPEPEPEVEFEDDEQSDEAGDIAFEGEDLFDNAPPAPAASAPQPKEPAQAAKPAAAAPSAALSRQAQRMAAAGIRPPASTTKTSDGRPVLQFSKPQGSEGFFSNDLGQYPFSVRLAVGVVVTLIFVGLFYFAYRGANTLKGRAAGPDVDVEVESTE